jgi:RNA polymerase sigma-70 factor (ECF subfamily)
VIYCLVPAELAAKLHDPLRRHFLDEPNVEVVVERRGDDRRLRADRRAEGAAGRPRGGDRRRVRGEAGRRVADRRASVVESAAPSLPRRARPFAARLRFVERVLAPTEQAEDRDTARLVARIQAGDGEAFGELYMRYFDRVYGYLRVVFNDSHAAEDATQQVFMRVMEALPDYEHRGPFRGWLFTIARNHALTELRKRNRLEVTDPADLNRRREAGAEDEADLAALDWITDRDLLLFIERLPLPQRQVLLLRYMLDLPHAQIARILDRSPDDVRMLQSRAQRFLRERLTAVGRRSETGSRTTMVRRRAHAYLLRRRRFALMR